MYSTSLVNMSMDIMGDDVAEKQRAREMFGRRLWMGRGLMTAGKLLRQDRRLLHLSDVAAGSAANARDLGIRSVQLDDIRGTENRDAEFDADFLPLQEHVEHRWVSVASAMMRGVPLPPIELIRAGETYFVRDGHHRVSVARAQGQKMIEAHVIAWH